MSKAFTKEDDDAGFVAPPSSTSLAVPAGPLRLTASGARALARAAEAGGERAAGLAEALARAEVLADVKTPERAALGVTVVVVDDEEKERRYRLVTPEELALLGEGCSVQSPLGRALLGATKGEAREVVTPRGAEELTVVDLHGE